MITNNNDTNLPLIAYFHDSFSHEYLACTHPNKVWLFQAGRLFITSTQKLPVTCHPVHHPVVPSATDTGVRPTMRWMSRGHQFVVRAGGHIDMWTPLYQWVMLWLYIFSCDQAALWMVPSVLPSVYGSHYFFTIFLAFYYHEILLMAIVTSVPKVTVTKFKTNFAHLLVSSQFQCHMDKTRL